MSEDRADAGNSSDTVRLDDYATDSEMRRIDFIKLDVEGAELRALQGASDVLAEWHPTILVEINQTACNNLGYEPEQIWEFVKPFGYKIWAVGSSASSCQYLSNLSGIRHANVILHVGELPPEALRGWTFKSVVRFHAEANPWFELTTGSPRG